MRATDLIERLQDLVDQFGDLEVLVAHQPSYPLQARPQVVTACAQNPAPDEMEGSPAIYIACAASMDYAPRAAWDEEPSVGEGCEG